MQSKIFTFFEVIAEELCSEPTRVITRTEIEVGRDTTLFDELKIETRSATTEQAIIASITFLDAHFRDKGSTLPFTYDASTGRFDAIDLPYLCFIKRMSNIRSINTRSQEFELQVMEKLQSRATGSLHRVGHPRTRFKKKSEFNAYLKTLGFSGNVLLDKDKDGGLDILWMLPIGSSVHRPIVSIQCKNGVFNMGEGDKSVGAATRSLNQHRRLIGTVHVQCVLFNDYLYPEIVTKKGMTFVPLGLTDLSTVRQAITTNAI